MRFVSKSFDGLLGCVPIHSYSRRQLRPWAADACTTSAYGLSSWMEKSSDFVVAANRAAAESLPTLPGSLSIPIPLGRDMVHTPFVAVAACVQLVLMN